MSLFFNMNESGRIETIKGKWASDEYRIPAGTPISANGEIANNGNAVGILVSEARLRRTYPLSIAPAIEVKSPKGRFDYEYRVITAGFVNKTEAEKEYGEAYTAEAKSAMKNINFVDETDPNSLGGSGGAKSWNDLEDKPFGEEVTVSDTVTWDGVLNDSSIEVDGIYLHCVSECAPTMEQIIGGTMVALTNGEETSQEILSDFVALEDEGWYSIVLPFIQWPVAIVIPMDSADVFGVVLERGVYFTQNPEMPTYIIKSITVPNYEFTTTVVKKIDAKYLPDNIGGGGGLPVVNITTAMADRVLLSAEESSALEAAIATGLPAVLTFGGMAAVAIIAMEGDDLVYAMMLPGGATIYIMPASDGLWGVMTG